jgi:hypothetical protein
MIKRAYILILLLLIIITSVDGQSSLTYDAFDYHNNKEYLKAAELINRAIIETDDSLFTETWQLRAIIYWDIYVNIDNRSVLSDARVFSLISVLQSIENDAEKQYFDQSIKLLDRIALTYYNDAAFTTMNINVNDPKFAENSYLEFKRIKKIAHPGFNFDESDINFYNALSTTFARAYDDDPKNNKDLFKLNIDALNEVLAVDSNNYGANYNMAIYNYNEGAVRVETIDSQVDFAQLLIIEEYSVNMFKKSLPFMLKANKLRHRKESIKGLVGIYTALHDYEKAEYYSRELRKLEEDNFDK